MSAINYIPRGLRVLMTMAIMAVLVWRFAVDTEYYYYSIGAAVLITSGIIFLIYRSPATLSRNPQKKRKLDRKYAPDPASGKEAPCESAADSPDNTNSAVDTIPVEKSVLDVPPIQRGMKSTVFKNHTPKPEATEVAARYLKMARMETGAQDESVPQPPEIKEELTAAGGDAPQQTPPIPLIEDETTLTEDEKNELVNAVWYRCENPYCKYSSFLEVHHILDEKDGGTNSLDNLIVLCPYCHDLAHRKEIPEKEMRDWISSREERFKFKPRWQCD